MMATLGEYLDWAGAAAANAATAIMANLTGLFGPHSRFFLPYLGVAVLIAAAAHMAQQRNLPHSERQPLFADLFSRKILFHPSSLVDLKVVFANRLFLPVQLIAGRAAVVVSAYLVAVMLTGGGATEARPLDGAMLFALALCVLLTNDFTTYWVHRLHHEQPVLWPFHKLHHSAEVMTPLTFARKHPVYDILRMLSNAAIVGPAQGIVIAAFGVSDMLTILGVNVFYAVFHWTGSNLRHSHVWLSYGPFWSKIFISPAQHQIHHSCAVRHHDKNYGEVFALWDWMFGTLYVPKARETLEYGVADSAGNRIEQPHPNLKEAWLQPLRESAEALNAARGKTAPEYHPAP